MVLSPFGLVGALISLSTCGAAMRFGRKPERLAAASLLLGLVLVPVIQDRASWLDPQFRLGAVDLEIFATFAWLTTATRRAWLLYATAFQLLSVMAELLHAYDPRVGGRAFLTVVFLLGYAVDVAMAVGVVQVAAAEGVHRQKEAAAQALRLRKYFCNDIAALEAAERNVATAPSGGLRRQALAVRALLQRSALEQ